MQSKVSSAEIKKYSVNEIRVLASAITEEMLREILENLNRPPSEQMVVSRTLYHYLLQLVPHD